MDKEFIFTYNIVHSVYAESEGSARDKLQPELDELYKSTEDNEGFFMIPHAKYWKLKVELVEPPDCVCGHSWEDHHLGMVMNWDYVDESLRGRMWQGALAEECEAEQLHGIPDFEGACFCSNFKPNFEKSNDVGSE